MNQITLTIGGQTLRISGEGLEVEIVDRDFDDIELNEIADFGARLDERFLSQKANAGGDYVDRSAERAAPSEGIPAGQGMEPGIAFKIVDRNTSGPDVKRAPDSNSPALPPEQADTPAGNSMGSHPAGIHSESSANSSRQTNMAGAEPPPPSAPAPLITMKHTNIAGPQTLAVPGGEPGIPIFDAKRCKNGEVPSSPGRSDEKSGHIYVKSKQAATPLIPRRPVVLRPHCLNPQLCAGSGANHCHACRKAMATEGAAA